MSTKSMTDIAYEVLLGKKRAIQFSKLWEEVSKASNAPKDQVSQFYSDMTLDSRFTLLKDNKWDLAERRKYNESHVDLSAIELDEEEVELIDESGEEIIKEEDKY